MRIDLDNGQVAEIAVESRVVAHGPHERGQNTVFAAEGEGKDIPCAPWREVTSKFVELRGKRRAVSFPGRGSVNRMACWQILVESCVEHFDLRTCSNACSGAICSSLTVGGRQFVREWQHYEVNRASRFRQAEKIPFDVGFAHTMGSRAVFLRLLLRLVYTNSPCVTPDEGGFIPIFEHTIELEITHISEENNPLSRVFIVFGRWVYMGRMTIQ